MPFILQIYMNAKLLCVYIYKTMQLLIKHSNNIIGYTMKQRYKPFFKISKVSPMDFNKFRYVNEKIKNKIK